MTGNQLVSAYTTIVSQDLSPVGALSSSGVSSAMALSYINIAARRICRILQVKVKKTITYNTGTDAYDMTSSPVPVYEVHRVTVGGGDVAQTSVEDESGYYIQKSNIVFNDTYSNLTEVTVYGFGYPLPIVASDTEVTTIDSDLHASLVQLAVVEGCYSDEDTAEQIMKLKNMESAALARIAKYRTTIFNNQISGAMFDGSR